MCIINQSRYRGKSTVCSFIFPYVTNLYIIKTISSVYINVLYSIIKMYQSLKFLYNLKKCCWFCKIPLKSQDCLIKLSWLLVFSKNKSLKHQISSHCFCTELLVLYWIIILWNQQPTGRGSMVCSWWQFYRWVGPYMLLCHTLVFPSESQKLPNH